jgi:aromatic-L-amino-acid decarboxylase
MTPEEFRRFGHWLVDFIADYRARVGEKPVMSRVSPGSVRAQLEPSAPEAPESFADILRDVEQIIMPGLSHWQHPSFFAYFPSNGELSSVLGDYLSTGLGVLGVTWQSSPALSELEELVCDWMRQAIGLSDAFSGAIQDTASTSTLLALICARERTSGYALASEGLQGNAAPLTVYASAESHSSVDKAALLAGFGRLHVRRISADAQGALRPDLLKATVLADLANGLRPCAVVATTGTTATTAYDRLPPVVAIARAHNLWLHVDAAMAGSAMILPECRHMWEGIEGVDSLVLNPHKWLGAAFDCSLFYTRDSQHLVRVMSTNPSYLQSNVDGQVKNLRDWGLPLGRRFRALKLWCLLREQGLSGLRTRLRRDLDNARWLGARIAEAPRWQVVAPIPLQTVCVRHVPPGLEGEALDQHTLRWAQRLNESGLAYVTPATLDGRWMVRISIGAIATERAHVAALWKAMQDAVVDPISPSQADPGPGRLSG